MYIVSDAVTTKKFAFAYAYEYASPDLEAPWKYAATWAGQEGSFLLWALWTAVIGGIVAWKGPAKTDAPSVAEISRACSIPKQGRSGTHTTGLGRGGNKSTFGDMSVFAGVPNPDNLSAFAAERSTDGALTIMVVNKVLSGSTPVTLNVSNFAGNGTAQVWQVTAENTIRHLADLPVADTLITTSVPQQSITLFVLPPKGSSTAPTGGFGLCHGPPLGRRRPAPGRLHRRAHAEAAAPCLRRRP